MLDISHLRKEYQGKELKLEDLNPSPFIQFSTWFKDVLNEKIQEPNAMVLSTATKEGIPSSRVVLLKEISDEGFIFFTNYDSRKGKQLSENPFVSITFYWSQLERQINIEGHVIKLSKEKSFAYFDKRPRENRLGTWASKQSQIISSQNELLKAYAMYQERFHDIEIPMPPNWGGYCVIPSRFEFWQGQKNRLHIRFCYYKENNHWIIKQLAP